MPRPVRPWFRFYVEAFADRKIRRLKPEYRWLFVACLGAARQSPTSGILLVSEGQPMDPYDIADYAGMDVRSVKVGLRELERCGLIVKGSPGDLEEIAYRSPTFQDRQYESDDVTSRTRKHRSGAEPKDVGTFQRRSKERPNHVPGNAPETETETETEEERTSSSLATNEPNRFDEFWETYSHKVGRAKAEKAYTAALKKPGVTPDLLIASAAAYIIWQMSEGKHPEFTKHPTTWLHGEHWRDERPARPAPQSNVQGWMQLTNEIAEREGDNVRPFRAIGGGS